MRKCLGVLADLILIFFKGVRRFLWLRLSSLGIIFNYWLNLVFK